MAVAAAKAGTPPALPRAPPSWIERFPWEEAKDEMSSQLLVFFVFFSRFVGDVVRDEISAERSRRIEQSGDLAAAGAKDQKVRARPAA
jgi:hypothetical protein